MRNFGFLVPMILGVSLTAGCEPGDSGPGETDTAGQTDSSGTNEAGTTGDTGSVACEPVSAGYVVSLSSVPAHVERVCKFAVPVNYVRFTHPGTPLLVEVAAPAPVTDFTLSPKSKNVAAAVAGNVISFTADEPGYFVLQIPGQERVFILLDPPEVGAPVLGEPNVRNIMDVAGMDNTGATDVTALVQGAIDAASGAAQNILYFPAGTYATQALYLRDNMTVYLQDGAMLQNITTPGNALSQLEELASIEGSTRGYIVMDGITNAKLIGRGTIDGNGTALQPAKRKMFAVKIEDSSDCVVEGIISRDSAFWNTMIYRSDNIHISNFKVINNRLEGEWNETDGVDFNNCTNSTLTNAFLYTGDDCMAVKSDDIPDDQSIQGAGDPTTGPYINVANILHEQVVCFSGSSACKVGTKTFGESMSDIVFRDVDIVTANRALVIDAVDTATISGTIFEDIRIEETTGRLIDFNMDAKEIFWRTTLGISTVTNTEVTNVSSDANAECRISGAIHNWKSEDEDPYYGEAYYYDGVTFTNFSIQGNIIESIDDPNANFNVNEYVTNVTFAP